MFLDELITSIVQLLVFSLIPFVVYLVGRKSARGFLRDIGFYRPEGRTVLLALLVSVALFAIMWGAFFVTDSVELLQDEASVAGRLRAAGLSLDTALALIVIAWIKTSLSEEILFRGFAAKRLIRRLGFQAGNILQALIFGVIHGLLIALVPDNPIAGWKIALIVALTGAAGWIIGWIKERRGNGSIIPGWIAHAVGNTIAYSVVAFAL